MNTMRILLPLTATVLLAATATAAPAAASPQAQSLPAQSPPAHPMRFFEGRTESVGTVKAFMRKPFRSRSIGRGRIEPDGSLSLVQRVDDEGKPPRERRWRIREVGSGRYSGTMSEATGPVTIDEVGGRYRFRFKMKGNLSVEQWLAPLAGGMSARNFMTVRKFGMVVATGDGMIRKFAGHRTAAIEPPAAEPPAASR